MAKERSTAVRPPPAHPAADVAARRWRLPGRPLLLEVFVVLNLTFLVADIVLAHAANAFGHWAEWIPLVYCVVGAPALAVAVVLGRRRPGVARWGGLLVGWGGSWSESPGSCGTWRAASSRSARCGPWSTRPPSPPPWPSPGWASSSS